MQRLRLKSIDATTAPRIILLVGLFLSPSIFDLGSVKPFDVSKIAVLWFFGWVAFAITAVEAIRGEIRLVRFRLAAVAGVFLAVAAASTVFSRARLVSIFGWYGRYNGLLELVLYVAIFWLIVQLYWRRPERLREVLFAVAAASIVLTVYILIQWAGVDPIRWVQPSGRAAFRYFGTMGNSNFAGGYLGATSAWLVWAFWRARGLVPRVLVVVWAFLTLFALFQTSSRDGLVGAFVSGVAAVILFRRRLPRLLTGAVIVAAAFVVVAGVAVAIQGLTSHTGDETGESEGLSITRTRTLVVRTYWWRSALAIVADRPLVGAGPDTFITQYPRYALPRSSRVRGAERTDEPHNILLERASSLGLLGLGTYLALIVLASRWGLRRMRDIDGVEHDVLGSFLVLAVGYLGQGFFSIDVPALAATGWVAFGGIAALADPSLVAARARAAFEDRTPPPRRAGPFRLVAAGVAVVVLAAVVVSGLRPWLADRAAKQAQRDAADTASTEIVMTSYRRAIALAPYDSVYRGLAANFLVEQARHIDDKNVKADLLVQAIELDKQMDALLPGNASWKTTTAGALAALAMASDDPGYFEEADTWFTDAAEVAPYDRRVALGHGLMLNQWGQATRDGLKFCEAIDRFKRAIELRPEKESYAGLGQAYASIGHIDEALEALETAKKTPSFVRSFVRTANIQTTRPNLDKIIERVRALRSRQVKVINCA